MLLAGILIFPKWHHPSGHTNGANASTDPDGFISMVDLLPVERPIGGPIEFTYVLSFL